MKITVVVGGHDEEFECPIEEASFFDVTIPLRVDNSPSLLEIPSSVFAAAPELLKACRMALSCMAPEDNDITAQALSQAIDRAEGKETA